MRAAILVAVVMAAGGCGGGDEPSYEPLAMSELESSCDAFCDYEVDCGLWADDPSCQDYCHQIGSLIRGDAADQLLDCYLGLACDAAAEASCLADTIDGIDPSAAYDAAHAACTAAESRCDTGLACEVTYFTLLSDGALDALAACFDGACDDIQACLEDVLGPVA